MAEVQRLFQAWGREPLTREQNAWAFPAGEPGLSYKCDLVEYRKPVPRYLLKREVDLAPKWPDICLGPRAVVQVRVGWDQHGLPVELVRVAEAVLAADENGHDAEIQRGDWPESVEAETGKTVGQAGAGGNRPEPPGNSQ
jgi:hypothetical protein